MGAHTGRARALGGEKNIALAIAPARTRSVQNTERKTG